ncbi:transposase protein domain-containing protein [Phthorimaea operculella]|nr:transposase protein domain-containing protein [Phthorimaea operculella]
MSANVVLCNFRWSIWLRVIGRDDLVEKFQNGKSASYRVCSDHFKEENFIYRKILKQNVLPTCNLPVAVCRSTNEAGVGSSLVTVQSNLVKTTSTELSNTSGQQDNKLNTTTTTYDQTPFHSSTDAELMIPGPEMILNNQYLDGHPNVNQQNILAPDQMMQNKLENTALLQPSQILQSDSPEKRKFKDELPQMQKKIKMERSYNPLNAKNEAEPRPVAMKKFLEYCDRFLDEKMAEIVKCHARMVEKFKGNRYTMEFKLFALNLYFRCPQSYRFLEQYFHLPSIRTLQRMHIPISSGLNSHLLKALESKIQCMSEKEKVCSVCVNAISIKPNDPSKDKKNGLQDVDNVVGADTAKCAVVLMANGLFTKWQQPIAFELKPDISNYTDLTQWIDHVIGTLLEIGLDVRALTSNIRWDFLNSAKLRNINKEQTYFHVNGHKIYYIFDVPDLIINARNNLMKYDFNFGNKVARWAHVETIFERDSAHELKLMPKITEKHVKPNNSDKLRIKFAIQIFSYTVAAAIQFYVKARLIENGANDTKDLIKMFNDIFDVLNSDTITNDYVHKRAYKGNNDQKKFLLEALGFLESFILIEPLTNKGANNLDFIEGFIVTIKSIMGLHDDLKQQGHSHILTRNLNQECLEDCFSQIRQTCKEPTALQFSRSFRNIFLTNILKTTATNKDGSCEDDLTTILFKLKDLKE